MTGATHSERLCPRCYASLPAGSTGCGRCGAALPVVGQVQARPIGTQEPMPTAEVAPYCPRCDRLDLPGARFTGALADGRMPACPHCGTAMVTTGSGTTLAYEEVSLAVESWDLDRLVRAEAVDGWTLVDTTIDPSSPQRLLAHFRRALPEAHAAPAAAAAGSKAQGAGGIPHQPSRPAASAAPAAPASPREPERPADPRPASPMPPVMDARGAKAAAKEARRAAKEAHRAARWERRRGHWEKRLEQALGGGEREAKGSAHPLPAWGRRAWRGGRRHPLALLGMVAAMAVGIALFIAAQLLRHLVLPLLIGLAMAFRQALLSVFWGITGPQGARRR